MTQVADASRIEQVIMAYIKACNEGDAGAIAACFVPDAVHYFPWRGKWPGAESIGRNFADIVRERGGYWTVDQLLVDPDRSAAALEWSFVFRQPGRIMRGVDWIAFDPKTFQIREVRPYIAAPLHPDTARLELQDFDYAGRGYPA